MTLASVDQRRQILSSEVAQAISRGGRVESQTDYQAVVVSGRRVNHLLHLVLSILTVGIWLLVWAFLVVTGGEKREVITVGETGMVSRSRGKS